MIRLVPLFFSGGLLLLGFTLWQEIVSSERRQLLAWLNITLLLLLALVVLLYGLRMLRDQQERRPGSRLRAKLVMALVGMLLVPTLALQITANQMVERGLSVWFDVRVEQLLDRALELARGFYARVEFDLRRSVSHYTADPVLTNGLRNPLQMSLLVHHLSAIRADEGWQRLQLFDLNEQLVASVEEQDLATLGIRPLDDGARLAMTIGRVFTELQTDNHQEIAVAYAPLADEAGIVGLLRAEVALPSNVVESARSVEADYKRYRLLEHDRQDIQRLFTNALLIVTLIVTLLASLLAIFFARRLTQPIGDLAQALQRITEGDLNVNIPEKSGDELGSLVASFNRMAHTLRDNVAALESAHSELGEALHHSTRRQTIMEALLANLHSGVLLVDGSGSIQHLNLALRQLLRLPLTWGTGGDFRQLCHQGRLEPIASFFDTLLLQPQGHLQTEADLENDDGQNLHLLIRGARVQFGDEAEPVSYLLVVDDISFLAEAQRHRAWAEVARRLAHEIKNPLTPIKLAAERMQRRFREQVEPQDIFDGCTSVIIAQVERLQRLVSDFTTLARLPKANRVVTDLAQVVREMRDLYGAYPRVEVTLASQPLPALCDADQMRQVLINLMDNALAATGPNQQPVRLYAAISGPWLELHVEDMGNGISPDHLEHLFEPYFSTKSDGSGLGLAIARRIADEHEASLLLLSPRQPTHFCLRLARADATANEQPPKENP